MVIGIDDAVAGVSKLFDDAIDKIWPNPVDKASAQAMLIKSTADAAISKLQAAQSVMLAEANSKDGLTSRARPTFLYVIYILILSSLPYCCFYAYKPDIAKQVVEGFHAWLTAIPDNYMNWFGAVLMGYMVHTGAHAYIDTLKDNK